MLNNKVFTTAHKNAILILLLRIVSYGIFILCIVMQANAQEQMKMPGDNIHELHSADKISLQMQSHSECNFLKSMVDETKGTIVKMMEREKIIAHTPDEMKEVFPGSDYLAIEAYLNNFNGTIALLLKISIQANNPQDTYGSLYKDSKLLLKLATGETITLYCGQSDAGNIDIAHTRANYMTFFTLDAEAMSKLQSSEVTKARLFWAKGYEDYTFRIPDFFIRQIACVK